MPRSPDEIIRAEINVCVSSLVSTLAAGQAIAMDSVIQEIAADLAREYGEG